MLTNQLMRKGARTGVGAGGLVHQGPRGLLLRLLGLGRGHRLETPRA